MVEQPLYRLQLEGWTPIIAHPERNVIFQAKPELLASLIRLGAKTQVTCGSLTGAFGPDAQRAAEDWIGRGMVHILATDAHNPKKRPPLAREAIARAAELAGGAVAEALSVRNPAAVIGGRALEYEPDPEPPRRGGGFLDRLKGLWGHRDESQ
jgi:protein-tyrosine phosphatase